MTRIRKAFLRGFREGWTLFWSPFTGFVQAYSDMSRSHKGE